MGSGAAVSQVPGHGAPLQAELERDTLRRGGRGGERRRVRRHGRRRGEEAAAAGESGDVQDPDAQRVRPQPRGALPDADRGAGGWRVRRGHGQRRRRHGGVQVQLPQRASSAGAGAGLQPPHVDGGQLGVQPRVVRAGGGAAARAGHPQRGQDVPPRVRQRGLRRAAHADAPPAPVPPRRRVRRAHPGRLQRRGAAVGHRGVRQGQAAVVVVPRGVPPQRHVRAVQRGEPGHVRVRAGRDEHRLRGDRGGVRGRGGARAAHRAVERGAHAVGDGGAARAVRGVPGAARVEHGARARGGDVGDRLASRGARVHRRRPVNCDCDCDCLVLLPEALEFTMRPTCDRCRVMMTHVSDRSVAG
mmetsp:Transcript_23754/g.58232  ORF Transcript_23754/g.58232 Transcript_23754/m.58232 type:complete len:358 (+) Transcript_23754:383-1456(+)